MTRPSDRTLHVVVPALDEAQNVGSLFSALERAFRGLGAPCRIVLVDDGSSDGTADVARAAALRLGLDLSVVQHVLNQGPGAAFMSGFRRVLRDAADDDLLVTIEADNTSDLGILPRMRALAEDGADVVLASVYGKGRIENAPFHRHLLSAVANLLVKMRFGLFGLHTFSSFYRVRRVGFVRRAMHAHGGRLIESNGFVCMVEELVRSRALGARIAEVPMVLDFAARVGRSKMRIARTIRGYAHVLCRLRVTPRTGPVTAVVSSHETAPGWEPAAAVAEVAA